MAFEFKAFDEMTPQDYAAIGLKAGLEIHQQLMTEKKLFCRCPAGRYSDTYDAEILRHMRPTLSELGEYDGTALMEFKTKKEIVYRIHSDTVCTYEMDDTPPFMMNEEALDIALEVGLLLNLNLVNELHIARKQYLDGSIPTGFQRTTILGVDGWIPYKGRKIRIAQLGLEEDACREVSDVGHQRVFLTDRLGMPLIETVTKPDMRTPQEAAEVGEILRKLVRATRKVRTGHGAAREDVNVSIDGGTRVEIKGVPSLARIPLLIYNESMRQWNLLRIREILMQRGITPSTFTSNSYNVTRLLAGTQYAPIQQAMERGEEIHCVRLDGYAGILNEKTQTDTTFAKEISDRVRVVACLTRLPNIAHSDAASETLSAKFWKGIRHRVNAQPNDALVLVWGNSEDAQCGCNEIAIRAREATEGIPSETRQALRDGTNGFERILPGPDRMYPDTDLPPQALSAERVDRARSCLPEPPWARVARYEKMGLPEDVRDALSFSARAPLFDRMVNELEVDPTLAGVFLCQYAKALRQKGLVFENLSDEEIYCLFEARRRGRVSREGLFQVAHHLLSRRTASDVANAGALDDPEETVGAALDDLGISPISEDELRTMVENISEQNPLPENLAEFEKKHRYLMGVLMKKLKGRAEGGFVSDMLEEKLNQLEKRWRPRGKAR